jgi:hypothetical protein
MTALLDTLKKSLNERRHQFSQAEKDLNATVHELKEAVQEVSSGIITVELAELRPVPPDGPTYELLIRSDRTEFRMTLGVFVLTDKGYPIFVYANDTIRKNRGTSRTVILSDLATLRQHVSSFVDGVDSMVVQWIATDLARTVD